MNKTKSYRYILRFGNTAAVFALIFTLSGLAGHASEEKEAAEDNIIQIETESKTDDPLLSSPTSDPFSYASDYEEIYEALADLQDTNSLLRSVDTMEIALEEDTAADTAEITLGSASGYSLDNGSSDDMSSSDYSTTNIQEAGVDEGDVVKTDGSYLYILRSSGEIIIVEAENEANVTAQITIESENDLTGEEIYLDGDILSVVTTEYATLLEEEDDVYYTASTRLTVLYTYDITDRSAPVLTGSVTQEGYYSDSRKVGNYIYLFSSWYPTIGNSYEDSDITPLLNGAEADASCYYLPDTLTDSECLIISSVDISAPSEFTDNKILVSGAQNFYVSQENIYIINENYQNSNTVTELTKFHYEDGTISGVAAGSVTGYLNDSFSLSEYNGNLRLVTTYYGDDISATAEVTDWTEHNALYILDDSLNRLSTLTDLAEGETIRSARFLGDTGYFVTFRQTDPLFSVDLSDPADPQILGELKISGFSSYLHFYGDGLLLGLGYEADESTGTTTGLKLSMFDISDPSNVTEVSKYVISGVTWCESLDNYKSILVNADKNIIGFYCEDRYLVFSYDEDTGFVQEMIYDFYSDQLAGQGDSDSMRGLYINDTLYLAGSTFVIRFDISEDFEKTQVLVFE